VSILDKLTPKVHAGYIVEDVEACLKSVQEKFGCALDVKSYIFAPTKSWSGGVDLGKLEMRIAMCPIGDKISMEFIQPLTPAGYHFLSLVASGDNLNHLAFTTDRFDECRAEVEAMGAVFVYEMVANDPVKGYRRNIYAKIPDIPGIVEILENATAYRPEEA